MERAYPQNKTYELYSSFVFGNDDKGTIEKVSDTIIRLMLMASFRKEFDGEQVNFLVIWIHSGGKATKRKPTDSAFFWRKAVFHAYVTIEWVDKWMELDMRRFLARVKKELRTLSYNGTAAFINFPDRDFPTKFHERAYYGENLAALREVKKMWDPQNLFAWAQGVRRPGDPEEDRGRGDEDDDEAKADKLAAEQWEKQVWAVPETKDMNAELNELADLGYDDFSD